MNEPKRRGRPPKETNTKRGDQWLADRMAAGLSRDLTEEAMTFEPTFDRAPYSEAVMDAAAKLKAAVSAPAVWAAEALIPSADAAVAEIYRIEPAADAPMRGMTTGGPPKTLDEKLLEAVDAIPRGDTPLIQIVKDAAFAQAYALRVWSGQSVTVPRNERIKRVTAALEGQGLSMEGVVLP